jgi:hypothetical protein
MFAAGEAAQPGEYDPGDFVLTHGNAFSGEAASSPGMPSASPGAAMVPWAALEASPHELDMRCSIYGGKCSLASGVDQGAKGRGESDKMSLSAARPYILTSGRTTYHGIPAPNRNATPLRHPALAF